MDSTENSYTRTSQIRPPSRIPSPGKSLAEITESQTNARPKSMLPAPQSALKHKSNFSEPAPKRKTLAERAGEPGGSNVAPTSKSAIKGTSLIGASIRPSGLAAPRTNSIASSKSSRTPSTTSRSTSNSSFASSVGPGVRPRSVIGRSKTSMAFSQSTTTRPRPATSFARHNREDEEEDDEEEVGPGGKRKAWDVRGRLEDMEAMYSELKTTLSGSNMERNGLEEAVTVYKSRITELETIRTQLQATNTSLQTDLELTRQRLTMATDSLEDERRRNRNETDDLNRSHRNEIDQLRRENTEEVERLIRVHREELRELERRSGLELEEERAKRLRELQEIKTTIALEHQNSGIELTKKDRELQTMRGELEDLKGELDRQQTLKNNLQTKLGDASINTEALGQQVTSLRAQITFLESDNTAQSHRFEEMEQRLQEALKSARESKEKLIKEETLRRILFNQVQELKGNIRVMCRVRPTLPHDAENAPAQVEFPDTAKESKEVVFQGAIERSVTGKETIKSHPFSFDRVFGPTSQNEEVFDEISQLVQSALDGYNVCIFCYGQTGSGKTHTMSSADGMIPRATRQIYSTATALEEKGWKYNMEGSFIEVYNEDIHDLLGNTKDFDKKKHEIRHDQVKKQTTISGVNTVPLDSPDAVETILKRADNNRSVAATKSNERSSRSHSVFILKLVGHNSSTGETSEGTLNLVDLAGSERLKSSGAEGDRMKETQNINKSLSCLGDVIGALGSGKDGAHIPYRNSKLTYLLQYSLGGNSKTLMFVMVSPLQAHLSETLTSLKFATKVYNTHIGTAKKSTKVGKD